MIILVHQIILCVIHYRLISLNFPCPIYLVDSLFFLVIFLSVLMQFHIYLFMNLFMVHQTLLDGFLFIYLGHLSIIIIPCPISLNGLLFIYLLLLLLLFFFYGWVFFVSPFHDVYIWGGPNCFHILKFLLYFSRCFCI